VNEFYALEALFACGKVQVSAGRRFARLYFVERTDKTFVEVSHGLKVAFRMTRGDAEIAGSRFVVKVGAG
jgi:hypothetical protein